MNLSTEEREQVATELKRFASDLNLTDDQKEKLRVALTEAREKIADYMQNMSASNGITCNHGNNGFGNSPDLHLKIEHI